MFDRWRHSRGYGVHSPLGFRVVRHVLRPASYVVYYGEERLEDIFPEAGFRELRQAKRLLRLVAELQPSYVWTSGKVPDILLEAVRLGGCVVRIYDGKTYPEQLDGADMVILADNSLKIPMLRKAMAPGKTVVGFNAKPALLEAAEKLFAGGVFFEGGGSFIAINTADPVAHRYPVLPI